MRSHPEIMLQKLFRSSSKYLFVAIPLLLAMIAVLYLRTSKQPTAESSGKHPDVSDYCVIRGATMGTTYTIRYRPNENLIARDELVKQVERELDDVNQQMSTYRKDSEITRFNDSESTEWIPVSSATASIVSLACEISELSSGAFDVSVGPLVNLWGFGPNGRRDTIPSADEIQLARAKIGHSHLRVRLQPPALKKLIPSLTLDLSAIAKGHGVDRVSELLHRAGIEHSFVEIGGEIAVKGHRSDGKRWQVGIEAPQLVGKSIQRVLGVTDCALATSGDYRNYFVFEGKRYSHTIDPISGWPVEDSIASASVIADKCANADAIATCMMVLGPTAGMKLAEREGWAVLLSIRNGEKNTVSLFSSHFAAMNPEVCEEIARERKLDVTPK